MKRFRIVFGFLRLSIAKKIEYGRNVITKLTGNASFSNPDPPLAQMTTLTNNLETAAIAADGGGKAATAAMHASEKLWEEGFRKLALYVEKTAAGSESLILSAGFDASRQPVAAVHPEFSVKAGKGEGEVMLIHKGERSNSAFVWVMSPDPLPAGNEGWTQVGISIQAKFKVVNLEVGKKYWFRVAVVTRKGQGPWCDAIQIKIPG